MNHRKRSIHYYIPSVFMFVFLLAGLACENSTSSDPDPEPDPDPDPEFNFDGDLIAFRSDRDGPNDIWLMTPDGSESINITNSSGNSGDIAWSPDGSKIAFASESSGNTDIYIMSADGTDLTRLTDHLAVDRFPSWSPDEPLCHRPLSKLGSGWQYSSICHKPGWEFRNLHDEC